MLRLRQRFSTSSNYPVIHPIPAYHYYPQYYFVPLISLYRYHPLLTTTTISNTERHPWHLLQGAWLLPVPRLLPGSSLPRLSPIFNYVPNICYCRLRYWVVVEVEQKITSTWAVPRTPGRDWAFTPVLLDNMDPLTRRILADIFTVSECRHHHYTRARIHIVVYFVVISDPWATSVILWTFNSLWVWTSN